MKYFTLFENKEPITVDNMESIKSSVKKAVDAFNDLEISSHFVLINDIGILCDEMDYSNGSVYTYYNNRQTACMSALNISALIAEDY